MNKHITLICTFLIFSLSLFAQNWQDFGGSEKFSNAIHQDGGTIYASLSNDILKSDDGGANWSSLYGLPKQNDVNPGPYDYFHYLGQRAIFRETGTMVIESRQSYIGDQQTMIFSNDRGASHAVQVGQATVSQKGGTRFFDFYEKDPTTFVMSVSGSADYYGSYMAHQYSVDGGETWQSLGLHSFGQANSGRWDQIVGWIGDQLYTTTAANAFNLSNNLYIRNFPSPDLVDTLPMPDNDLTKIATSTFTENGLVYHIYALNGGQLKIATYSPGASDWTIQNFNTPFASFTSSKAIFKKGNQVFLIENPDFASTEKPVVWRKNLLDNALFTQIPLSFPHGVRNVSIFGSGNNLFMNYGSGVFQSSDGGVSWMDFSQIGNGNSAGGDIRFYDGEIWSGSGSLFFKYDGDEIWETIRPDLSGRFTGSTIYTYTKFNGNFYLGINGGGLYRWDGTDGGVAVQVFAPANATYSNFPFPTVTDSGGRLFFSTEDANRNQLDYYSDDGMDWILITQPGSGNIGSFYQSSGRMFSAQTGGYFYSDDDGATWTLSTAANPRGLKKDPISGDLYFFIGDFDSMKYRLYRSSNNGTSWQITSYDPPSGENIEPFGYWIGSSIFLLRGEDMLARFRTKTYKGKTNGTTWEELSFPFRTASGFYNAPDGNIVFSSKTEGVWSVAPSELFGNTPPPPTDEKGLSLSGIGDPANPGAWTNATAIFTLKNNENYAFSNISVRFNVDDNASAIGGDEYTASQGTLTGFWLQTPTWNVGNLAAGESATIELNYFTKTANVIPIYGQVFAASGTDSNSTPGNGTCCTAVEDDEAIVNFNGAAPPPPTGDPDLSITGFSTIPQGAPGEVTTYTFDLNNTGGSIASGDYEIGAYLSEFSSINANSVRVGWVDTGDTPVGTIRDIPGAITIPADMDPGFYYLILWADDGELITELSENNNQVALPFQVTEVSGGLPDLTVVNLTTSTTRVRQDGRIELTYSHKNTGNVFSPSTNGRFYWSTDSVLSPDDEIYTSESVYNLAPGATYDRSRTIYVDRNMPPGTYYLIVAADPDEEVAESDETNNYAVSPPILVEAYRNLADLQVRSAIFNFTLTAGGTISPEVDIRNSGDKASGVFKLAAHLSTDRTLSPDDIPLTPNGEPVNRQSIPAGMSKKQTFTGPVPLVPTGTYYTIFTVDPADDIEEFNETDNTLSFSVNLENNNQSPTDLSLEFISAPMSGPSGTYTANYNLLKTGGDISQAFFVGAFLSQDRVFDTSDRRIGVTQMLNGMSENSLNFDIDFGISQYAPGNYTIFLVADFTTTVPETNEANNVISFPFEIGSGSGLPDLEWFSMDLLNTNPPPGGDVFVEYRITNTGSVKSDLSTIDFYVSSDQTISSDDHRDRISFFADPEPGEVQRGGINFDVPNDYSGTYYVIIELDRDNEVAESDETNNIIIDAFTVGGGGSGIDLELEFAPTTPANPQQWGFYSEILTIKNTGTETATGVEVEFKVSAGATYKGGDEFESTQGDFRYWGDEIWTVGSLAPGSSATLTVTYFLLNPDAPIAYAQVKKANEADNDSTPNNGTCCSPNEDDEASTDSNPPGSLPDIRTEFFTVSGFGNPGGTLDFEVDVLNSGAAPVVGNFVLRAYISADDILSNDDIPAGTITTGNIAANMTIADVPGQITIPANLAPGSYNLILNADDDNQIAESNESNNGHVTNFTVFPNSGSRDMTANRLTVNFGPGFPADEVSFNFFYENAGSVQSGVNQIRFKVWMSSDQQLDAGDVQIADNPIPYPSPGGNASSSAPIPTSVPSGQYYLILEIDSDNQISESDETNNRTVSSNQKTVGGSSNGVDLELSFDPATNQFPAQWSFSNVILVLKNNGTAPATGVKVQFEKADEVVYKGGDEFMTSQGDFQYWGNEIWTVGNLAPGEEATLEVNYFILSPNIFTAFAQVSALDQSDVDSAPGNGVCCGNNEDDEAAISIGSPTRSAVGNRTLLAENIEEAAIFGIVNAAPNPIIDQFNLEVFSNEGRTSEVMIFDVLGRPVLRKAIELSEGHNSIPIDASNLPNGFLTVKMSGDFSEVNRSLRQIRVLKMGN